MRVLKIRHTGSSRDYGKIFPMMENQRERKVETHMLYDLLGLARDYMGVVNGVGCSREWKHIM